MWVLGMLASDPSRRQIESWNDFVELNHENAALLVATAQGLPPNGGERTRTNSPGDWPVAMTWTLLAPEHPGQAAAPTGDDFDTRISEVRWTVVATTETDIGIGDFISATDALLNMIEPLQLEYIWIAPGFGPFIQTEADTVRVRVDMPIAESVNNAGTSPNLYDAIMASNQLAEFGWLTFLTMPISEDDKFLERLEPVHKSSYVFRIKPTR